MRDFQQEGTKSAAISFFQQHIGNDQVKTMPFMQPYSFCTSCGGKELEPPQLEQLQVSFQK
jgi:hypothetical protein